MIDQRKLPAPAVDAAMEHHPDGELSTRITLAAALDALLDDAAAIERAELELQCGGAIREALTAAVQVPA